MSSPAVGSGARNRPRRADAVRNRELVLRVARQRLLAGDSELSLNALAPACGLGVGTVYRHFPTRELLIEALAAESVERMLRAVDQVVSASDPAHGLEELLRVALRAQLDDPALAAVMEMPNLARPEAHSLSRRLWQAGNEAIEGARVHGLLRADVSSDDLRRLLSGLVRALRAGDVDEHVTERYLMVLLQGLRPPRR